MDAGKSEKSLSDIRPFAELAFRQSLMDFREHSLLRRTAGREGCICVADDEREMFRSQMVSLEKKEIMLSRVEQNFKSAAAAKWISRGQTLGLNL